MQKQFEAITKIAEALKGLDYNQTNNVLTFVQSDAHNKHFAKTEANIVKAELNEVEEPTKAEEETTTATKKKVAKKTTKKKVAKKVTKKAKEPEVVPTMEEMVKLCRDTANRLKSGDKIKALIQECCGVPALKDADPATFIDLAKKLGDA